jgi:hypothetical protein
VPSRPKPSLESNKARLLEYGFDIELSEQALIQVSAHSEALCFAHRCVLFSDQQ